MPKGNAATGPDARARCRRSSALLAAEPVSGLKTRRCHCVTVPMASSCRPSMSLTSVILRPLKSPLATEMTDRVPRHNRYVTDKPPGGASGLRTVNPGSRFAQRAAHVELRPANNRPDPEPCGSDRDWQGMRAQRAACRSGNHVEGTERRSVDIMDDKKIP